MNTHKETFADGNMQCALNTSDTFTYLRPPNVTHVFHYGMYLYCNIFRFTQEKCMIREVGNYANLDVIHLGGFLSIQ